MFRPRKLRLAGLAVTLSLIWCQKWRLCYDTAASYLSSREFSHTSVQIQESTIQTRDDGLGEISARGAQ